MNEFLLELLNTVEVRADVDNDLTASAFMTEMAERMAAAEEIENLIPIHFRGQSGRRNSGVDGHDLGDTDDSVALAISHFDGSGVEGTMGNTEVQRLFGLLEAYLRDAVAGTFPLDREPSEAAVQLARDIHSRGRAITRFRLYLFTDLTLGSRVASLPSTSVGDVPVDFHIWDLQRLEALATSSQGRAQLDLDLTEWSARGVPALTVRGEGEFETYLAAVPGNLLADLYGRYGSRLLESNVRSFLSGRGNINRGIRTTILSDPHLFLAYNNGVTATATDVETGPDGSILRVRDLQIVNGGQTTASLFYVRRDSSPKPDLSKVHVQMKLVVVEPENAVDLVPNVSRYANSQNRISEADFFSNSPFHVRMETLSRQVLVPSMAGTHFQTKWFYERTRGQYQNERAKLSPAEAKKFEAVYPRAQLITKTDAAKYSVSWGQEPHKVSAGAQKNFLAFANSVADRWASNDTQFNEAYFKELVAKAILFQAIRARVAKSEWYQSGYLANIVAYTMAKLAHAIATQARGARLDFLAIWNRQDPSAALLEACLDIAHLCFRVLTAEQRPIQNVTEWAKREQCWELVKKVQYELPSSLAGELVLASVAAEVHKDARATQRIDTNIAALSRIFEISVDEWKQVHAFCRENRLLSPADNDIVGLMTGARPKVPSERQAARLLGIHQRAMDSGFR
ncbi:AIPR family protein [Terracoccus sp. 273MFTsu3.1]|uniref:AIPR family protein n=1 Tax=Terracoccus sp. 273MFTsu3.1 TaxID=1172188 RepID=UPI00037FA5BF|nr:AIPR family protein [Terracoccus sp. 273MFTsu3.1]